MGRTQWNLSLAGLQDSLDLEKVNYVCALKYISIIRTGSHLINNQELGGEQEQRHTSSAVGHEKEKGGLYGQEIYLIPAKHVIKCLARTIAYSTIYSGEKLEKTYDGTMVRDLPTMQETWV